MVDNMKEFKRLSKEMEETNNHGILKMWIKSLAVEIENTSKCHEKIFKKLDSIYKEMGNINIKVVKLETELKLKTGFLAALWGILGGAVPVIVLIIVYLIKNGT